MQKLKPHSCRLGACTLFWIFLVAGSVAASATLVADYCVENTGTECTTGEAYGLWLPGIEAGESDRTYEFDAGATFTQNDDGTAVLVGTATLDGSKGYFVEVNFGGRTSIAPSGSPKEDFCAWDPDTSSYYYYTAISGTLSGLPGTSLAGAVVTLTRRGPAFQVGVGANLQEHVLGASGWFDWELVSQATGGADLKASGHGDFNFNLVACDPTEPNCENNVTELTTFDSRTRSENPANLAAFIAAICDLAPDRVIDFETGFADGQYIGAGHFLTDYRVRIYSEEHSPAHDDVEIRSNLAGSTPIGNLGAVVWTELKSSYIDFYEHPVDYVGFYLTDVGFDNFGIDIEYTDGSKDTIVSDKTGENCTCEEFVGIVAEPGKKIQRIAINPNQFTGDYGIDNIIFGDCEGCCIEQDPVLSGVPGDLVLDCTDPIPDPAVVVAVDFEGNSIPVVFEETTTGGACDKRITRVWTAIDSCENEVSVTQTIVVSDTEPPIFTSIPEDEYIECKPPVIDCEPCDGGVTSLTLLYAGSAGQVTIRDDRAVYFQGALAPGEAVTINGTRSDGRFEKNELKLYVGSVENVRIHVSCSKPIGVGMVFGDFTVLAGASRNGGALCPMDGGDPGCGACKGGVTRLVLQYGGSAGQVVIRDDRETYFSGSVQTGELIEINGTKSDGKFEKNELTLSVDGHEDARIHVSCSKPIDIGLSFGSFLVVDGASKDNGSFCPSDGGIIPPIITAVDNCDPNVEVVFTETSNTVNCAGIITRTWTATDACGNSTSVTQNIIYGDVTPPVLSGVPLDAEYTCVADVPLPPVVTVDDNCDDDLVVLYEEIVEGVCPTIITRVWTAIDSCGNEVSATQTIVVSDTEPPIFTSIPEDEYIECKPPVINCEPCDGGVTSLTLLYAGSAGQVTIQDDRAVYFQGALVPGEAVTITGTRSDGRFEKNELKLYVGSVENVRIHVSCSKPIGVGMVFGDFTVLAGASRNGGALCPMDGGDSGCGACDGGITRLVLQYGGSAGQVVIRDDRKTYFSGSVQTGELIEINGTKSDGKFEKNELTLSVDGHEDTRIHVSCSKPVEIGMVFGSFLVVDGSSRNGGSFCPDDGTTACGACKGGVTRLVLQYGGSAGQVVIRDDRETYFSGSVQTGELIEINGTKSDGKFEKNELTLSVDGHEDARIHVSCSKPIDIGLSFGSFLVVDGASKDNGSFCPSDGGIIPPIITAVDNCDPNVEVVFTETSNTVNCAGIITRTWTATDACGNSTSVTQNIIYGDVTPPVLSGVPLDAEYTCVADVPLPPVVTVDDNCDDDLVVLYEEIVEGVCPTIITRVWTAIDSCGNEVSATQTIVVSDTEAPVFTGITDRTITLDCDDPDPEIPVVHAVDNCAGDITVVPVVRSGGDACRSETVLTWTAADACGNSNSVTWTIIRVCEDFTLVCPDDMVVNCDDGTDPALTGEPSATSTCSPVVSITYIDHVISCSNGVYSAAQGASRGAEFDGEPCCAGEKIIIRTWTATTANGDVLTCEQVIRLIDNTPPLIACEPGDHVQCVGDVPGPDFTRVTVWDTCSDPVVTVIETNMTGTVCDGRVDYVFEARDACGNVATCTQTWYITDTQPPVLVGISNRVFNLACDDPDPVIPPVAVTDNCDNVVTVEHSTTNSGDICHSKKVLTWTPVDICGNVGDTVTWIINRVDDAPPVLVVGGDIDITVAGDCTYTIPNLLVSVTDVCTPASGIVVTQDPAPGTVVTGPVEVVVTLVASDACDSTTKTVNVKVSCLASLGDYVWLDENADGFQDSSEPGVSNVTVILWRDQAGIPIQRLASNQTDATGFYVFVDLDPNLDYRVQFIRPAGYEFTIPNNVPGNDGEDSDAHPVNGFSDVVELDAGEHDPTIDAGLVVPDITIIKKVGPAATNPALPADLRFADGEDDFLVVPCGSEVEYCFKVTNSGRAPLFNVVINDPTLGIANLPVGNLAVGASAYACVDGSVVTGYVDNIATTIGKTLNHIEVSDKDPVAVDCGDITLIKKAGTRDDSLTVNVAYAAAEDDLLTVACGTEVSYCFKVINSGNHPLSNIVVTDPILGFATNFTGLVLAAGDEITFCVVGGSVSVGLTNTARVDAVADTVPVSDDDPVRVACEELASLGDYVWLDEDQDGCQDSAEPGVAGVTVTLYESIGGTPVNNLGSKLTDKDGGYLFTDLDPNKDYMVEFTLPPGFVFTQQGVPADDSKDSDASPLTGRTGQIELDPGENDLTNDAGLIQVLPGLLIGVSDPGCNCAGVPIDLTIHVENTGNTTLLDVEIIDATFPICSRFIGTLAAGVSTSYVCTVPAPPSTVTNSVLVTAKDLTGSTVTKNSDFTMDVDTQPPIIVNCPPGGFVECLADVPAPEIPAAVDNCDTVVVVTVSTVIENGSRPCVKRVIYTYTAIDDCGNQASCTETWTVEDLTPPIIVGVSNQTFNLSCDDPDPVIPPVSAIDNCEQVTVSIVSNLVGDVCSSMKTITFSVVDACNNAAQVVWIINKSDTTPPVLSCPTLQPVLADGNCEGVIPDVVPDVVATDNCGNPVTVVQSPAPGTKVGLGTHIITVTATDPCGLASTCKTVLEVLPVSGAIGDTVWNDINADGIQDPGDPPVDGVTVRLRGPGGVLVGTDVTAGGGQYLFTNVAAGTYSVEFVLLPPFAAFTLKGSGAPDVDSNANPDGSTDSFIISCGETNRTVDAGLVDTGAIACKVTSNPPMVTGIETPIGSDNFVSAATVTWTVEVSNPRQIGLENIAVTDTRCGALLLQGGDTDNDSILDPGETWIYTCVDANPTFSRGLNISNVVTVSGVDLVGTPVGSSCQAELVTVGINMEKRAPAACAGDEVTYTLITRMVNGDPRVQLRNIEVVDNLCTNLMLLPGSDKNNNGFLDFGETFTNTCTRVVSQTHTNTATDFADVFFDGVFSGTVNSEAMVVVPVDQPGLALNAVVKNLPVLSGGGAIVEVTVSNTGNVDLHNVQVSNGNPDFGACDFTIATLPVGGVETRTCTSSPLVGFVVNSMNVTAASARDCAASDGFTLEVETETVPEEDIAGTLFCDADGDGVEDLSETNGLPGVQVDLLRDGFPFRTTTTDAEGGYEFTSVPTGNYAIVVSATDPALSNALIGPASALVNPVTLADQDQIVDIGFVIANATIDGFLFESLDKSGAPNNFALTGFNGIEVILKQVTDTKVVEVDRTTTAANGPDNGYYAFTGKAGGRYLVETVAVQVEAAMLARKRAENPKLLRLLEFIETSPGGEIVTFCENGSQNLSFFASIQTAIRLASFEAEVDGEHVVVNWSTASETRNFGFNVYRSSSLNGQQTMVNARMILASGTGVGAVYSTLDVKPGAGRYFYWLEDVDLYGKATRHDPVSVLVGAGAEMKGGFDVIKPGMAKVTHAVLAGSGLADYARVAVFADGVEIPAFVADGDYFLFYIREGVKRIEFGLKVDPKRMAQFELIQE